MACVNGVDAGFKLLPVAAGMDRITDIVVTEDRQRGGGVADEIVGGLQRFQADEIIRAACQLMVPNIGDLSHVAQSHIGGPRNQTSDNQAIVRVLFPIAAEHMLESLYKVALLVDKMQHAGDIHLRQRIKKRMVHRVAAARIRQTPACLPAAFFDFEVIILAAGNAPVDLSKARFKLLRQLG